MASTHKSLRSGTANKRPTTSIADGQIALNTNTTSPGLFFKDSTGATIIKVGPVHVGTTAPNASPAAGGSAGNSVGEIWLDTSLTPVGVKIWNGSAFVNATPIGSTTVQGLLELATNAETQTGTDPDRAVTPAGLQSKVSDSTSTTSSTTIASSTAVKSAYDLANAALPKSGGTVTGNLEIGTTGSLSFEGATADAFETTIAVVDPTADRTITLPDTTGTVVTTGDTGTVTSTMIADGTIVDGDISASSEIAVSKLADGAARQLLQTDAAGTGVEWASNIDVPGTLDVTSTATFDSIASHPLGSAAAPTLTFTGDTNTGIYSPGADQVAISTGGSGRLFINSAGRVGIGVSSPAAPLDVAGGWIQSDQSYGVSLGTYGPTGSSPNQSYLKSNSTLVELSGTDSIVFRTNGGTEAARLTSTGRLGVGTSSPVTQTHIVNNGGVGTPIDVFRVQSEGAYFNVKLSPAASPTDALTTLTAYSGGGGNSGNSAFAFSTRTSGTESEKVRIDSSGRVGIGTSSPATALHVDASGGGTIRVSRISASAGAYGQLEHDGTNTTVSSTANLLFFANGAERARIDTSGRLGIGTTSPGTRLHVSGTQGDNSTLYITSTDLAANNGGIISIGGAYDGSGNTTAFAQIKALKDNATVGEYGGSLAFFNRVGTGGLNERARIDSSGRLLVGTSTSLVGAGSIAAFLQVSGTSSAAGASFTRFAGANAGGPTISLNKTRSSTQGTFSAVLSGDNLGDIFFNGDDGAAYQIGADIFAEADADWAAGDCPTRLVFSTTADGASSPTERMRIANNGESYITSTGLCLGLSSVAAAGTTTPFIDGRYGATAGTPASGTQSFRVWTNGNVQNTNNSYTAISDIKLKENIVDANSQWADLKALRVRNYNLKEGQTHRQIGLIAQEVEPISPGLVYESPDRDEDGNDLGTVTKSVNYSVLYMKAVKALQEAMERIEVLEQRLSDAGIA